jgi:putative ABC transport system ATP-binding protein
MLDIRNVSKVYGSKANQITALDKVSLSLKDGEFIAIMGPSGSGKSTLLNIIGGLDDPTGGEIILDGQRIDSLREEALVAIRRHKIAYVFQQYHLLPSLTALENVMLPLVFRGEKDGHDKSLQIMEKVGLKNRAGHKPGQLSGGEQQRVAIARALVGQPSLILADEPTGNMDRKTGTEIMTLFAELNNDGHSIIMVTHDPVVAGYAHKTVFLQDGRVIELALKEEGRR